MNLIIQLSFVFPLFVLPARAKFFSFLACWRSPYLHALLPLEDVWLWGRNLLLCAALGLGTAAFSHERRHGHPPKNYYVESLFEVGCAEGLHWASATTSADLLAAFPRYHPRWAWWLVRVPGLREVLVSNLVLVLRAR